MLILMKIYRFVISQFRVKNSREVFFLLLKLTATMIILGKIYANLLCLGYLAEKGDSRMFACYLAGEWLVPVVLIYLIYQGAMYCKRKGVRKHIIVIFVILNIITSWVNGSYLLFFYWDVPYWGRVIDADTGEPVEGACIAGIWRFMTILTFDYHADARETITGKNGWFFLPPARAIFIFPLSWICLDEFHVFKPGYDSNPPRMYYAWTEEDTEKWRVRLRKKMFQLGKVYDEKYSVKVNYNRAFSVQPGKRFIPVNGPGKFMPLIIKLNKAESAVQRKTIVHRIDIPKVGDIPDCEEYKIRRINQAIDNEITRFYGVN